MEFTIKYVPNIYCKSKNMAYLALLTLKRSASPRGTKKIEEHFSDIQRFIENQGKPYHP
jgi:hypothetical protein